MIGPEGGVALGEAIAVNQTLQTLRYIAVQLLVYMCLTHTVIDHPSVQLYTCITVHVLYSTEFELPCLSGERHLCLCMTFKAALIVRR